MLFYFGHSHRWFQKPAWSAAENEAEPWRVSVVLRRAGVDRRTGRGLSGRGCVVLFWRLLSDRKPVVRGGTFEEVGPIHRARKVEKVCVLFSIEEPILSNPGISDFGFVISRVFLLYWRDGRTQLNFHKTMCKYQRWNLINIFFWLILFKRSVTIDFLKDIGTSSSLADIHRAIFERTKVARLD